LTKQMANKRPSDSCNCSAPKSRSANLTPPWCILKESDDFSRDYVGYLARQTVKHLVDAKVIGTAKATVLNERVTAAMIDELALEDRINDEVRVILDAFQEDIAADRRELSGDV